MARAVRSIADVAIRIVAYTAALVMLPLHAMFGPLVSYLHRNDGEDLGDEE